MKKKICAFVLLMSLVFSQTVTTFAENLDDAGVESGLIIEQVNEVKEYSDDLIEEDETILIEPNDGFIDEEDEILEETENVFQTNDTDDGQSIDTEDEFSEGALLTDCYEVNNEEFIVYNSNVTSQGILLTGSITLGNSFNSSFTSTQNENYYRFTINTSGRCEFKLVSTELNHCWIDIYNSDNETEWEGGNGISAGSSRIVDLTKGTYYLRLKSSGEIGSFTMRTNFTSSNETFSGDNGTIDKANTIVLGNTVLGQLADNRNVDFYKFTINTSGRTTFKLVSTELNHCWIDIYDTDYGTVWEGGNGIRVGNIRTVDLTNGTYYLRILSSGETGAYTLKTTFTSSGEDYVGNNGEINLANSINLNSVIKGQLAHNRKCDYYKFILPSQEEIKFKLSSTELEHCWIDIYDTDYGTVWEGGNGIRVGEERSVILDKGTYILRILSSGETGAYLLSVSNHVHSYKNIVTKATVSSNGKIVKRCSCGAVQSTTTIYYPKTITLSSAAYTYDGKVKKPSVTVKGSDGKVISSANYTVSYASGRKNVGTYKVSIKFKGNYSGTVSKTFKINPKATSLSKLTAKSKGFTVKWKKQTEQVSGYQIQYSTSKSFSSKTTKTITKNSTTSATYKGLKAKKKYYVRIRTYKKVSGTNYYSSWSSVKTVTTKK